MRPGFEYTLRWGQLGELSRLAGLRTYERIKSGDPDGAAQAIVQNLRLVHPLSWNNRANTVFEKFRSLSPTAQKEVESFIEFKRAQEGDGEFDGVEGGDADA